ncbi:MAG: precorrin-6A reductase [Butyrivibrio sp.]|nr:precorrin-6A reductase [Muribaculum sp.]MCM1552098.1 precorrin-6A reductase [Butyrivibrio sp.]
MNGRILIFAGTTEGRRLAELLARSGLPALVCVATEYGKEVMKPLSGVELRQGRMNAEEMLALMQSENFPVVVDATHPFATEVSANIRAAAGEAGTKYLRLQRATDARRQSREGTGNKTLGVEYFESNEACAEALMRTDGNVLLTVGSKELAAYCSCEGLRERLIARVLPSGDSIAVCREQRLTGKQIIAMQGPFSEELNRALIREYHIACMVTKESGTTGGFEEKAAAARKEGCSLWVIGNPEKEKGLSFREVCAELEKITGVRLKPLRELDISLIGIGMGDMGTLTVSAREEISRAEYLFGAQRLLTCVEDWGLAGRGQRAYPYYLAGDILPVLDGLCDNAASVDDADRDFSVAVLFSGDSGFYSGAEKMYQALTKWKERFEGEVRIQIYPGISSVSYLASKCGMSWQDARIMSIHGRGDRETWEAEVLAAVRYHQKVFLLVSGVEDVCAVGRSLSGKSMEGCRIVVGFQLSYPEEQVTECTPRQCMELQEDGSYILAIVNEGCETRFLAPMRSDGEFIRRKAPMTKAEIRALVICKLKLTEKAVVYDIGSGTGSVAVEIAERSEFIRVFAVEQRAEDANLIRSNRRCFALPNITVVSGRAPEALEGLPAPTHVFIGGSGGNMGKIIAELRRRNVGIRVVITAVTMETAAEIQKLLRTVGIENAETIQVQVSRAEEVGEYHLMRAENPVIICSFDMRGDIDGDIGEGH